MSAKFDLARMRLDYETTGIAEDNVDTDPMVEFDRWLTAAIEAEVEEPNAMVVSTVDPSGQPWSRHVLLKGVGPAGFDFYTNYESNKSMDLASNPKAALTFGWLELHRQVNIAGTVARISDTESDAYWAVRTRGSQIGGWASAQSRVLNDRDQLLDQYEKVEEQHPGVVPRPSHWGGWRLTPHTIEFWQGRRNRLHDRLRYTRDRSSDSETPGEWTLGRLSP